MSGRRFVVRRLAGMAVTVWVVLTVAFAFVALVPDPMQYQIRNAAAMSGGDPAQAANAYLAATNQNVPVLRRYLNYLTGLAALDLGRSFTEDAPVASLLAEHVAFTLVYFVPALAFAVVAGTLARAYTVAAETTRLDRLTDGVAYLWVSVPVFLLAYAVKWWVLPHYFVLTGEEIAYVGSSGPLAPVNLRAAVYPAAVTGLYLFGVQLRYAGTELGEYASAEFVKTARAKGAGVWRVGRHVFRNAAVSLLSVFATDMLGPVFVAVVVVEAIADVPGFGALTLRAMQNGHDLPLLLGVSLPVILTGVVANFLQDVGYAALYPDVDLAE